MNYEKKRKRQNGRQKYKEHPYNIYIDEWDRLHATIDKAIKDGHLPPVRFDPDSLVKFP